MIVHFILNDPPYGTERTYNGLRLASNLFKKSKALIARGGKVLLCGTCLNARGLQEQELLEGSRRSTMDELTELTLAADKLMVF